MSLPKHKYLLTYRYAEIVHDLTVEFCVRNLSDLSNLDKVPKRRTIEQMIQAARSGKQNIIEGVNAGETSKSSEIYLLGIARSSLEELIADFEDFLRQRGMTIWQKSDPKIEKFKRITYRLTNLSNLSDLGNLKEKPILPKDPEEAANFLLTLCHIETFLLNKQVKKAEETFVKEGGYRENLFKKRLRERKGINNF